jgi:hypothetical protein
MASYSVWRFLSNEELVVAVSRIESMDDNSEISDFDSEYHPSDQEDSGSAVIDQAASQPSRKRNHPNPPLFQWHSGAFNHSKQ